MSIPADTPATTPFPAVRVGQGFDVHPFSDDPSRRLVLGGVTFELLREAPVPLLVAH